MLYSRRTFFKASGVAAGAFSTALSNVPDIWGQTSVAMTERTVQTPVLSVGFEESGDPRAFPIVLLHGFPDDVRAWDGVTPPLTNAGYRVLVPYLRGYGRTRFRDVAAL